MVEQIISSIRNKLPIQNPLHSFVHNNILQMFEHKDFHEALDEAGKLYRARPYWPILRYLEKFDSGKIIEADILNAIDHYLGHYQAIPSLAKLGLTSKEFFYRLMFSELSFNDDETQPIISNEHLWKNCQEKMSGKTLVLSNSTLYWRGKEYWERYHNVSYSLTVHNLIIRLISSFLDQGQSFWPNPFTNKSFWEFFLYDVSAMKAFSGEWQAELVKKVESYKTTSPSVVIEKELKRKGIPEDQWETYLLEMLFDLKGWAGMVNKLELEPWQAIVKAPAIKLIDYIAALVLIESSMDTYQSKKNSIDLAMILGRSEKVELHEFQLAVALYQITTSFKLADGWMRDYSPEELLSIIDEVNGSEHKDKIRLWHEAYEHHFHRDAIESLASHVEGTTQKNQTHYAQIMFCIDDREESIRRHLEETEPKIETYGVVGFFGIDMKWAGINSGRLIAQCPPVVSPRRVVREVPKSSAEDFHRWNNFIGASDLGLYYNSRSLVRGLISTLTLGIVSFIPMFVQVFFPHHSKYLRKRFQKLLTNEPESEILLEAQAEGHGYTKAEMALMVESVIRMCGFTPPMSDLIILLGHGSSSNNNPFKQAYGCGACGGNAGIPNSRAFAKMANDVGVRAEVRKLNLEIPDTTFFVSGYHDTCTDEVHFFNENEIPEGLLDRFKHIKHALKEAAKLNAFERCQRFSSFDSDAGPAKAIKHVRERAHDLAQPRPEYGHSSNALAIVGSRDLTKGLYMNRRSFLLSYDWTNDSDGSILAQVVLGGIPVAVNINMDYYFSCVDNENFGCGSKLPLNMTSLLGVMTGSQSDLRIGLARQMIEIHEPIRNMTLIEAPLEQVKKLFNGHPRLKNLLYHHWFRLCVKDPQTKKWWTFTQQDFEEMKLEPQKLMRFKSSMDLIKNHYDSDFAEIK